MLKQLEEEEERKEKLLLEAEWARIEREKQPVLEIRPLPGSS